MGDDFWSKVKKTNWCWEWQGAFEKGGYGICTHKGVKRMVHRVAYEMVNPPIKPGLVVRHLCNNTKCCNPDHLMEGTHLQNAQDRVNAGRQVRGVDIPQSRMTESLVILARQMYSFGATHREIAECFGIAENTALMIVRGLTWKHVGGPICTKYNRTAIPEVVAIRKRYALGGISLKNLGKMAELSKSNISYIVNGKSYPDAGGPIKGKDY